MTLRDLDRDDSGRRVWSGRALGGDDAHRAAARSRRRRRRAGHRRVRNRRSGRVPARLGAGRPGLRRARESRLGRAVTDESSRSNPRESNPWNRVLENEFLNFRFSEIDSETKKTTPPAPKRILNARPACFRRSIFLRLGRRTHPLVRRGACPPRDAPQSRHPPTGRRLAEKAADARAS
jgi:hypothetical protein